MSTEAMKLAFESWARPKWTHREDFDQRIKAKPGTYNNFEVQAAWEAWQAALSQQPATDGPVWFHKHWGDDDDIFYRPDDKIPSGSIPLYTHPAPSVLKDDQIAALVNKVRDIAHMFHDHQSLRERIAIELVPALKVSQEAKSNAERGRLLIKWLKRYGLLHAEFGQMGAGEKPEAWWLLHAPWGIDQTRPFLGHGKTPEQAIDAMLATKKPSA